MTPSQDPSTAERLQAIKRGGIAIQNACSKLGYICALSGEMACLAFGGLNPPSNIEAILFMPGIKHKDRPTVDTVKRDIAAHDHGPSHSFSLSSPTQNRATLFYHDTYTTSQSSKFVVEISVASGFHEADIQPLKVIDGLRYASPEFVLSTRLALWFKPDLFGYQTDEIEEVREAVQTGQIDPFLRYLVHNEASISKWYLFGIPKILAYCSAYPESASQWQKIGFTSNDPIFLNALSGSVSEQNTQGALMTSSRMSESSTSFGAPPPYQALPSSPTTNTEGERKSSSSVSPVPEVVTKEVIVLDAAAPSTGLASPTRVQMLYMAAERTIAILKSIRLPAAIFGSLACFMYGNTRSPNDIDILVLPTLEEGRTRTVEDVKMTLAIHDSEHFFLYTPRDPEAGYKVLYYRISGSDTSLTPLTSCKVDLVYPGTLSLPRLPVSAINWDEGLPLIPFSLLLLQKLQGWDHHGKSVDKLKVLKQGTDVEDLKGLLELEDLMQELKNGKAWEDERVFDESFLGSSSTRVKAFSAQFPRTSEHWREIGFL